MTVETAVSYSIVPYDLPDPDSCRTFDNGLDLFGVDDDEIDRIRNKHKEGAWAYHL